MEDIMKTRFNRALYSFLAMLIVVLSSIACGFSSGSGNTPEGVTRKLFDSLQENDANKYLDSITPADRQQPGYFFYRQLIQGIFGGLGLGSMEASKLKISFAEMKYTEISNDGRIAQVQVSGKLRDLNMGLEDDFSTVVNVVRIDQTWLVSLTGEAEKEVLAPPTRTNIPAEQKFAEQPTSPEQIAAAEFFDAKLEGEFRNGRLETLQIDDTFATVEMICEGYDPRLQLSLEFWARVDLRYISGKWIFDENSFKIGATEKGLATVQAAETALAAATANSAAGTQQVIQAKLGGTLIFLLDPETVQVRKPDGTELSIDPISGQSNFKGYDMLELSPDGDGIYFSSDGGNEGIFSSRLDGSGTKLLYEFEGTQTYFKELAISPDNRNLAVLAGSYVSTTKLWIIPTDGGEAYVIWEQQDGEDDLEGIAWAQDAKSIYAEHVLWNDGLKNNDNEYQVLNIKLNGTSALVGNWPAAATSKDWVPQSISVSPDGKDIIVGRGALGIVRISTGSETILNSVSPVCNPVWGRGADGIEKIVFASGNNIMVYNLASGELSNPYVLPAENTHYSGCPLAFDWIP
jgi:hypothetical protein